MPKSPEWMAQPFCVLVIVAFFVPIGMFFAVVTATLFRKTLKVNSPIPCCSCSVPCLQYVLIACRYLFLVNFGAQLCIYMADTTTLRRKIYQAASPEGLIPLRHCSPLVYTIVILCFLDHQTQTSSAMANLRYNAKGTSLHF